MNALAVSDLALGSARSRRRATLWQRTDKTLVLVTGALAAFGLVMVFSASEVLGWVDHQNAAYYFERQALWLVLGAGLLYMSARLDYHRLRQLVLPLAVTTLVLLLLVLVPQVGVESYGARRWLQLGPLTLQPAECVKLTGLLFMAAWLERRRERIGSLEDGVVPFLAIMAFTCGLIMLERDLGTTLVVAVILLVQFMVGGGSKRHLALLCLIVAAAAVLFIQIEPYRARRILAFLDPFADPLNTGFQSVQSLLALGSGGLFGVGLGQSIQKYQWLPFAHTDFIYAIIGEETGLLGTTAVLGGFALFVYRGYRIALRAPDFFGTLIACGITSWVGFQAFVNIAAVTVTLPTTGIPLPFISYGGSSLAISLLAVGILMNVASQGEKVGWIRHASVDLGRRYRRTPLSGDRGRASSATERS